MKWIGERISFVDEKIRTTIVINPQNIGWVKAVMGAWVGMWFAIGVVVIVSFKAFVLTQQEQIILYIFLAFWAYFAYKVISSWVWLMWGKELIKIDETTFSYKRSIRKYGKANVYLLENISKIRLFQPKENSIQAVWEKSPWIKGGERIEFDYQGKVVKLGRKLNEKDSDLLYKLITKRVEEKLRKLK